MDSLTDLFQDRAESNAPTQTSPSPSTVDPLLTASAGEAVTAAENNLIQDYQNLSAGSFIDKYGVDTYKSLLGQTLKTVESTLSQIRRRRARGTSGLWPSSP